MTTSGLRSRSASATPASVPPVPTAQTKPSTLPSVCSQISGPVVRTWVSRLATLSNWLAQIAPSGCFARQPLGDAARDLHIIVGVPVRHRGHFDQLAPSIRSVSFFSWLCVSGMTITVFMPSALPTMARPMPVLPAVPSTISPPRRSSPLSIASRDDAERRAVLDRMAGVHEFGLAEDGAAGFLRRAPKLDQRRIADRGKDGVADVHSA